MAPPTGSFSQMVHIALCFQSSWRQPEIETCCIFMSHEIVNKKKYYINLEKKQACQRNDKSEVCSRRGVIYYATQVRAYGQRYF